ncbi:hypothetical protein [Granulicoccus sp. GXG6511]|uniref:hypothetical protein n=1 Tax=Granulicoccus sp. GXG6511 TaxID=3381351 RepID=UPI003D7C51D7
MSALPVATPDAPRHKPQPERSRPGRNGQRRLRLVPQPRPRMARLPFLTLLIALVGAGMVGLLLLNTSLQNQAFKASELRRTAAEMAYSVGELEQLLTEAESTRELSRRATALGMRPNRDIAFVQVPDGLVSGEPRASDGLYLPSALTKSPEELAKERAERALKRADERRTLEQGILDEHRARILDARAKEMEERRRAAEVADAQNRPQSEGETSTSPSVGPAAAVPAPAQNATDSENR